MRFEDVKLGMKIRINDSKWKGVVCRINKASVTVVVFLLESGRMDSDSLSYLDSSEFSEDDEIDEEFPHITTFPITGHYKNDCPFCMTHNALLTVMLRFDLHECRDCHRIFKIVEVDVLGLKEKRWTLTTK